MNCSSCLAVQPSLDSKGEKIRHFVPLGAEGVSAPNAAGKGKGKNKPTAPSTPPADGAGGEGDDGGGGGD